MFEITNTVSVMPAETAGRLNELRENIAKGLSQSREIALVMTSMDVETASHFVKNYSKIKNAVEKLRKETVEPLNGQVKEINGHFKVFISEVVEEEERLSRLLLDFNRKQQEIARQKAIEERRAAEEKAIAEAIEKEKRLKAEAEAKGESPDAVKVEVAIVAETIAEAPKLSQKNSQGISTMKVAKWRVVDFSKIPDEFKTTDDAKITAARKAAGAECAASTIPGIEFYFEETLIRR